MSEPNERTVEVNGEPCRVWEKGEGEKLGFLAGIGGLPRWTPFLDRLAERCHVIAPSLPGFPGALGHTELDSQLDWVLATHDALQGAGLDGADLIGVSVGGALAADVAAIWPGMVRRLVLIAPLGLFGRIRAGGRYLGATTRWDPGTRLRRSPELHHPHRRAGRRGRAGMADSSAPRAGGSGPAAVAAQRHPPQKAPAPHHAADASALGRRGTGWCP